MAESQRRRAEQLQATETHSAIMDTHRQSFEQARDNYYQSLREQYSDYSNLGWNFRDEDFRFIDAVQPIVESSDDPQFMKERIAAAGMYSNLFNVPIETAFLNLENFHQEWTGQNFVKKSGFQAVWDSIQLNFVTAEYNRLSQQLARQGGTDQNLLQALQEQERRIDQLRDHAPKVWQDEYVSQGGWHDVGQAIRSVSTMIAENAGHLIVGAGAAALAATGVGAIAGAAGLSSATSALLAAGASRMAIAGSTYNSTWGIKYREMTNAGIPHDIALNFAQTDALIEGAIEGALGGIEAVGAKTIASAIVPQAVGRATSRWFISGKMGSAARVGLSWIQQGFEEGTEEFIQGLSSGNIYNEAVDYANRRGRDDLLKRIAEEPFSDIRRELEKELENYQDIDIKEWSNILDEAFDGAIGGFLTGIILGLPVSITAGITDTRTAATLARMAQLAPNEAAFVEAYERAREQGFNIPALNELKTDEQKEILSDVYKVQQERLTPEQREAKQRVEQDADALAEITDYSNVRIRQNQTGEGENKETVAGLSTPNSNVYMENGRLEIAHRTDINEDGSVNGRFVAGDPRIQDEKQKGINRYGYINYTESNGQITINEYRMQSGYENLRQQLFDQFAEQFADREIIWNPKHQQNIALRDQLINQNPSGPKHGLNYGQATVSNEARQVAQRFTPHMKNSSPLEVAMAAEAFGAFYRRRGESLNGAMNRLLGNITNDPNANTDVIAAQREGKLVKGATWLERTAEGMKRLVYVNKTAADGSTVLHETAHAVANDFTDAERRIASRALDGYQLKNGTVVYFLENINFWTDEQHEAFAEALENYFTNGTAPNEQVKTLFEKIKEFMRRIYQTMKGWTELSPRVEKFYQSLFSGELVEQARAETSNQTRENAHSETLSENTINDTRETENVIETQQYTAEGITLDDTQSHTEQRDVIIGDPDIPLEAKAEAVLDAAGDALFQLVYHGSPYRFNRFDSSHMGSGEGAQAYGWGHYFAGKKEVAQWYHKNLSKKTITEPVTQIINGKRMGQWIDHWKKLAETANSKDRKMYLSAANMLKYFGSSYLWDRQEALRSAKASGTSQKAIDLFDEIAKEVKRPGQLYEVDIPGDEVMLDWDKPLSEQSEKIKNELEKIYNDTRHHLHSMIDKGLETKGEAIYLALSFDKGRSDKAASQFLNSLGVKGIRYLDGSSRSAGEGSYNYVIFDDNEIQITNTLFQTAAPTDTKEFKNWFGDSKVVDENGNPKVVYHNTMRNFKAFNLSYVRRVVEIPAFFFAPERDPYGEYGKIEMPVYLSMKNPYKGQYGNYKGIKGGVTDNAFTEIREALIADGYDGIIGEESDGTIYEYAVFFPEQIKSINNRGTWNPKRKNILFQFGDAEMLEEAANFENGKAYRTYIEEKQGYPSSFHEDFMNYTEEQIDVWYDSFVQNSKKAVNSSEQIADNKKAAPAELDREFNEIISDTKSFDEFVDMVRSILNENQYSREDDGQNDLRYILRHKLAHPNWDSVTKSKGKINPTRRKQLISMMKNSPREYRVIYAQVMEREDLTVSPEDMSAAILKYDITDSRSHGIENFTPEKLRQYAENISMEAYAKKVESGRAKFSDPDEKAYIKWLRDEAKKIQDTLNEKEAERLDDNNHIERQLGAEFNKSFESAVKARNEIRRKNDKLDRAINLGRKDAERIAREIRNEKSNYDSIVRSLEATIRAHRLEIDVQALINDQRYRDTIKAAKKETTLAVRLARKAAAEELRAHFDNLKDQRELLKVMTKAKRMIVKRIFRKLTPDVNAEQGLSIAVIQNFAEPSFKKSINDFIGEIAEFDLRPAFESFKVDFWLQRDLLSGRNLNSRNRIKNLLNKNFEDLADADKKYLSRILAPVDWIEELGLEQIAARREENYPMTEEQKQLAKELLPPDIFYRIMDKPFSAWTLTEAQELAKIIDDLSVQGKNLYKANIAAERKRINDYQTSVINTIKTVKPGMGADEAEKILGKYDEGTEGTAQSNSLHTKLDGLRYADMNMYRLSRMLDNGQVNGKNMSALYRAAKDARNTELRTADVRIEKITNLMNELGIKQGVLWQKTEDIDLGAGKRNKTQFTRAELLGFILASKNEYSRHAVMFGNLLSEKERGVYQHSGVIAEELTELQLIAGERFAKVESAARKLLSENPNYQKLLDAISEDFTEGGKRTADTLVKYNNTIMNTLENYFPINRTEAVSRESSDAIEVKKLMGSAGGAFNLYVEKGFTKSRNEIPPQYQTAIQLDVLGVWTEAVYKEEHFISHAQLVKDLNQIYKQNRQVRYSIQSRYGRGAVEYIDNYIGELANPKQQGTKPVLDKILKTIRGNTAAAYLSWKASSIVKQFITSPAPFFAHMNPIEYWGTFVEFTTHKEDLWNQIKELSPYMKHRSANLMTELIKEQAKQQFDNKALSAISKFNKKGMEGLEWIDNMCVAPGWLVLFRKEQNRLTEENKNGNLSNEEIRVKAAQHADDITGLTQPSSDKIDIASLFKGNNELGKAILQFTQSLNVIWQNIRYDMPHMVRNREGNKAAGMIIGYTIASIMLGAITIGFDDEDDEKDKAAKIAWWSTMQFTDAIPLAGSTVTGLMELAVTGNMQYQSGFNLLPMYDKTSYALQNIIRGVREKDFDKLLKASAQAWEAAEIFTGLPSSARKEYMNLFGISDGDGELDFNPGAVIGRR